MLYIDILFLVNSLFDFALLFTMALWKQEPFRLRKVILASFVGGLWACVIVVIELQEVPFIKPCIKFLTMYPTAYLMIRIAFSYENKNKKQIRSLLFHFFVVSWIGGGVLNFLYYELWNLSSQNAIWARIILTFGVWIVSLVLILKYRMVKLQSQENAVIYTVTLTILGNTTTIQALWDSGNRLQDASGNPVCIVENQVMKKLLKEKWKYLEEWMTSDTTFLSEVGFQLVMYRCIGMNNGMLPTIKGEKLVIEKEDEMIVIQNPVLGYCDSGFSESEYEMILPAAYIL